VAAQFDRIDHYLLQDTILFIRPRSAGPLSAPYPQSCGSQEPTSFPLRDDGAGAEAGLAQDGRGGSSSPATSASARPGSPRDRTRSQRSGSAAWGVVFMELFKMEVATAGK
jgi:hypothetical protein